MTTDRSPSLERLALGSLVVLLLAPVIAQGLWRPLVHVVGSAGNAPSITYASLAIGAAILVVHIARARHALLLSLALGGLVAAGAQLGWSLGAAGVLTLLPVAVALSFLTRWLLSRLPSSLDGLVRRHRVLSALYVALAFASVLSTARMSIFMGDPTRVDVQTIPGEAFLETHSCLTAYVRADALSRQGVDNLYGEPWWHGSHGYPPLLPGVENPYSPFKLDYYAYPPPFLLVMAPLAPFEGDFLAQRALWFGLNGLLLAGALWVVSHWLESHRTLLLSPLFFGSLPVLATLQVGNFQVAVVVISVLAMVAFYKEKHATGGALLAFAVLSKISPAVLGIMLLAQRRYRAAAWTAGFGVLFLGLSVLHGGADPLVSFVTYTLPRLSSGEAFSFFQDDAFSILTNQAPFGIPFKLQLMGLDVGDPWVVGRLLGRVFTALLVALTIVAAFRPSSDRRLQCVTWMSLLVLASLQSPFAPGYTVIALLWAVTLLVVEVRTFKGGVALVLLWLVATLPAPAPSLSIQVLFSMLQTAILLGVSAGLVVRGARKRGSVAARPGKNLH